VLLPQVRRAGPGWSLLWPLAGLVAVAVLDRVQAARYWSHAVVGLLDEPAHLITAALLLAAWPRRLPGRLAGWALAGSVAIDADHVPLYLGHMPTAVPDGRPVTHCLLTAAVLLAGAGAARGRLRTALGGLALGVCLHLVRDVATGGTGVPLLWPLDPHSDVTVPYAVYAGLLVLGAAAATAGTARRRTAGRC
jgi:inner membrane protein